ncbi:MAG TPA: DUF2249 domain-containing protein [Acidimicrobiales bacterium]|nr:DUF2249 domain-containing protein [Acidimicrobiales bacterium]
MDTLDVRPLPPRIRHETIFERLGALEVGATLRLVNDHDPVPLRYQLDATRPGEFRWSYVDQGPEEWAVDISREVDGEPPTVTPAGGVTFVRRGGSGPDV